MGGVDCFGLNIQSTGLGPALADLSPIRRAKIHSNSLLERSRLPAFEVQIRPLAAGTSFAIGTYEDSPQLFNGEMSDWIAREAGSVRKMGIAHPALNSPDDGLVI
jgi:hypothetical protein